MDSTASASVSRRWMRKRDGVAAALFAAATLGLWLGGENTRPVEVVLTYYAVALATAWLCGRRATGLVVLAAPVAAIALFTAGDAMALVSARAALVYSGAFALLVGMTVYAMPRWLTREGQYRELSDELGRRTAELEAVIDSSPAAVITLGLDGTISGWNPAAERMLGWTKAEAIGQRLPSPPLQDELADARRAFAFGNRFEHLEGRRQRKDGEWIDIAVSQAPLHGRNGAVVGAICTVEDITERKRAEAALRESEHRFRTMADNVPVMIAVSDASGYASFFNRAWFEFTGRTPDQEKNNGWMQSIHPGDFKRIAAEYAAAFNERRGLTSEYRLRRHDGEYRWVLTSGVPRFDEDGALVGYVGSAVDITARRVAEEGVRANESKLRAILEAIPDMVFRISADGTFLDVKGDRASGLLTRPANLLGRQIDASITDIPGEALSMIGRAIETGEVQTSEFEHATQHGPRCYETRISRSGEDEVVVVTRDITEQRESAKRARFQLHLLEQIEDAIVAVDNDYHVTLWNRAAEQRYGFSESEALGRHLDELYTYRWPSPEEEQRARATLNGTGKWRGEVTHDSRDGRAIPVEATISMLRNSSGAQDGFIAVLRDVTERREAARAVQERERRLQTFVSHAPVVVFGTDGDGVVTLVEGKGLEMVGVAPGTSVGRSIFDVEGRAHTRANVRRALAGESFVDLIQNGETWFEAYYAPVRDDAGAVTGTIGIAIDATQRINAERELREGEERYRQLIETAHEGIWTIDTRGRTTYVNSRMAQMLGYASHEMIGRPMLDFLEGEAREHASNHLRTGKRGSEQHDYRLVRKDGSHVWGLVATSAIRDRDGELVGALGMVTDVTARRLAEEGLRRESAFRDLVMASTTNGIGAVDLDGRFTLVNPRLCEMTGYAEAELLGSHFSLLFDEANLARVREYFDDIGAARHRIMGLEVEMTRKDGSKLLISHNASAIIEDGRMIGQVGTADDITERKRLEAQYLQAQKMEGIGRLAGGVAHDFSNLMTAIMVNAELDLQTPPDPAVLREDLQDIRETAERAAGLAQQLLAFSRRQMIEPRVVSMNDLVRRAQRMLGRLVDERIAIELRLAHEECAAEVDPHQLEQVLVNLVVNARDAMPAGGTITIETDCRLIDGTSLGLDPVPRGEYVVLTVSDTGAGVPHDLRPQLFEPFFTTKDVGKGTGLGLSTCYGIVKQAGGHIAVGGEPGEGATFTIYLPAVAATPAPRDSDDLPADLPEGSETVLLVEDEPSLRRLAARVLGRLGYEVMTAADGNDALRVAAARDVCIDLVITDVVMPGMDGRDFARRLASTRPATRVLYMSGYTDDAAVRTSMADGTIDFLPKPFSPASLACKVREILDRQSSLTTNS